MFRQRVRKLLLILSFLSFPITIYYFSPVLIIQGAAKGIITGSFVIFALQFLAGLLFGRAFCGWLCPTGGLQEMCSIAFDKPVGIGKGRLLKYGIWVAWILTILAMLLFVNQSPLTVEFTYMTNHGISVWDPESYIIFYFMVFFIVLMTVFAGRRGFCHYICWMAPFMVLGNKLHTFLRIPAMHLQVKEEQCIGCKKCDTVCQMSLSVSGMVQDAQLRNSDCILCGACVDACPRKVLSFQFGQMKPKKGGLKWPNPEKQNM